MLKMLYSIVYEMLKIKAEIAVIAVATARISNIDILDISY